MRNVVPHRNLDMRSVLVLEHGISGAVSIGSKFDSKSGSKSLYKGVLNTLNMRYAEIVSGKLNLNSAFPSLLLEYKVAEGNWQRYTQPTEIGSIVTVRARIEGTQVSSREQVLER